MFRTELDPTPSSSKISYGNSIITLGSCFAQTIGKRLELNKFNVITNPYGVVFNPLSQFHLLGLTLKNQLPEQDSYVQNQGIWYNYDLHSDFSALSKDELELKIRSSIKGSSKILKKADWLVLTFGTAMGYYLKKTDTLVSNCHKVPSKDFRKEIISQKQILAAFENLYSQLKDFNSKIRIILTVSPVRHLKETLEINSVSKSILRITAHSIQKSYPKVNYFPAYELLLDDLRDYRFYADDMAHPSAAGEDYIWNKFCHTYLNQEAFAIMNDWEKVRKSLEHRPFHSQSDQHRKFLESTLKQLTKLRKTLDLDREIKMVESQLDQIS